MAPRCYLVAATLLLVAACSPGGPERRPLTMTPIEAPVTPPAVDFTTPTEPVTAPATGPAPVLSKGPRPKQCDRGDKVAESVIELAIGEIKTIPADLVQYAVSDDQVIQVDATASTLKVSARRSGRAEIWYVNGAGECTVLSFDTSARTSG